MADEAKIQKARAEKLAFRQNLFILACALLIGFAAGRSIAEAAGAISVENSARAFHDLQGSETFWVLVAMGLVSLFVFTACRFLLLLGQQGVAVLVSVQTRPSPWVALAIIVCGAFCLLAAAAVQWHESTASASVSTALPAVEMPGLPKGMMSGGAVVYRTRTSLMAPVTTVALLLAGLVIMGVGFWSSIPPRPASIVEADATRGAGKADILSIRTEAIGATDRPRE